MVESLLTGTLGIIGTIIGCFVTHFLTKRSYNTINSPKFFNKKLGIKNIYLKSSEKSIRNEIKSAKTILQIAYNGQSFAEFHRTELKAAFDNRAQICVLICKKNSDFLKDIAKTENIDINNLNAKIDTVVREYKNIKEMQKNKNLESQGMIEIRTFNTEFRNPVTIIENSEGIWTAFLSIMYPHKRAGDCIQIEFQSSSEVEECKQYFYTIWGLHKNDILYNSRDSIKILHPSFN